MRKVLLMLCCLVLVLCGCGLFGSTEPTVPETTAQETTATTPEVTEPELTVPETTAPETEPSQTEPVDPVKEYLKGMGVEEKVGQLFLARCNAATAVEDIANYHLGGFVLFGVDFDNQTPDSLRKKLETYQEAAQIPLLLAVDEEGGTVTRVSRLRAFRESKFPSPRSAYESDGMELVLSYEEEKSQLLSSLGLNVILGPVCDVTTDENAFLYQRSLGQDPQTTAIFVSETVETMRAYQMGSVLKHFPGYGNNSDTHTGIAVDKRPLEQLEEVDLVPFGAGIMSNCGGIMVAHVIVQALDEQLPASLSPAVHKYLREEMGFDGVVVTDDLVMQAITDRYGAGEAAVMAVLAGNDLLCSTEYALQYKAVLAAVQDGRIEMDVLDQAVYRVLRWKTELGLLSLQNTP